ncbi:LysO family transporter [Sedimentibacter sp. MB31-C6]|uniref:LysO family transporter n=1 Tax=Sedimentibacter sp. MB31-C6 TaxID=3109366 RepID=UPI002DDCC132|nr:LysO family transporter [Sedimentibacter sp. MB36-C1]WSI05222.1 LysO family transporter [Sedimentibacter sp. MB36-C1]
MALRILMYFGLLVVGWMLSSKGLIHEKLMMKISNIQSIILFSLIFIMGIRVGMDEQVVSSIGQIGIKAAVFAVITAGLSVLFVFIARKKLITDINITGGTND